MQALVGLFLFSVLLTTGASLECETCMAVGTSCSNKMETCQPSQDTCITVLFDDTVGGQTATGIVKTCFTQAFCHLWKPGLTFNYTVGSAKVKEVTCKAPSFSASLLFALSGLLLLKVLL